MKVLLINPPTPQDEVWVREGRCQQFDIWGAPFPPLSLAYIKTQIRDIAETLLLDPAPARLSNDALFDQISAFAPDIMIMSTTTPAFNTDCQWFAEKIRGDFPDILIGATGIHVTALPKESLAHAKELDFLIKGEPEGAVRQIIQAFKNGRDLSGVQGIAYRDGDKIIDNELPPTVEDIDFFGFPDWNDINFKNYPLPVKNRPFSLISFSRGCPYPCSYCAAATYYGKKIRKRKVDSLIAEIEYNLDYGVKDFLFWTELISGDLEYLDEVLEAILEKNLHKQIRWVCNSRVDRLNEDIVRKMKKAGCWQIAFGLEFGTNKALKLAKKGAGASIEIGREAVEIVDRAGIAADGHFIIGYPGEDENDIEETIRYAASLPLTFAHFYMATPFPGSPLYQIHLEENGTDIIPRSWDNISQDRYVFSEHGLSEEQVQACISRAYRKFYLSPARMAKISKIACGPAQWGNLARLGGRFALDILKK